jgi:hypothetical protein
MTVEIPLLFALGIVSLDTHNNWSDHLKGIKAKWKPRQASLPPNGRVTSGRIFLSKTQHMTDIIIRLHNKEHASIYLTNDSG